MKVILLRDVAKLGKEGTIVKVKDGYARNYLFPRQVALKAEKENYSRLEQIKKTREKSVAHEVNKFLELKNKIEEISLTIPVEVKDKDEIYGSISEAQIIKLLEEEGVSLSKGKIILDVPIKKLGVYDLPVKLHPQVEAKFRLWIVKK